MRTLKLMTAFLAAAALLVGGRPFQAQGGMAYSRAQIDQMVAPIALYPDALVSQVLMAATFPEQVADADQWMQANRGISGPQLDDALSTATWDPSVISLCKFPSLLDRMGRNMQWTTDLGYAFEGQRGEVMGAVQRLRRDSYQSGYLRSTPQQTVVVEPQYIAIQPYDPGVVYVPVYNPAVVYGPGWGYPTDSYRSVWAPSPGVSFVNGFAWGVGFAIGQALFGGCDWHSNNVYVNNTVIENNVIYHNTDYYRHRGWGAGGRHEWVRHEPDVHAYENHGGAPYGGEAHGEIHGLGHAVPPGQARREGEGEPHRPSYKEPYGHREPAGRPPKASHEIGPGAAHASHGEPYGHPGYESHPPTAGPHVARPEAVHPPKSGEYGRPHETMHGAAGHPAHPVHGPEPKNAEKAKERRHE